MSTDTGGPAFPTTNEHRSGPSTYHFEGMTLRDYFAAKALPLAFDHMVRQTGFISDLNHPGGTLSSIAADAYSIADAMLEARE